MLFWSQEYPLADIMYLHVYITRRHCCYHRISCYGTDDFYYAIACTYWNLFLLKIVCSPFYSFLKIALSIRLRYLFVILMSRVWVKKRLEKWGSTLNTRWPCVTAWSPYPGEMMSIGMGSKNSNEEGVCAVWLITVISDLFIITLPVLLIFSLVFLCLGLMFNSRDRLTIGNQMENF